MRSETKIKHTNKDQAAKVVTCDFSAQSDRFESFEDKFGARKRKTNFRNNSVVTFDFARAHAKAKFKENYVRSEEESDFLADELMMNYPTPEELAPYLTIPPSLR